MAGYEIKVFIWQKDKEVPSVKKFSNWESVGEFVYEYNASHNHAESYAYVEAE